MTKIKRMTETELEPIKRKCWCDKINAWRYVVVCQARTCQKMNKCKAYLEAARLI